MHICPKGIVESVRKMLFGNFCTGFHDVEKALLQMIWQGLKKTNLQSGKLRSVVKNQDCSAMIVPEITKDEPRVPRWFVFVDLAIHPWRIVVWIVGYNVLHQIKLESQQSGRKFLVEFAQGGTLRTNDKHTVPFDRAKITVIGGLIGRGKDMRLNLHGQEVVTEGAEVSRMR